jgi:ribosomal protein S18 acetylase RimI-like enzyme
MLWVTGSALPNLLKMTSARAKRDPRQPHWHVGPIGVHPDHQGHGVGKALLASFVDAIDEKGEPAFLETDVDRNVILYQQFGFRVIAETEIAGINTRFMWRTAPASSR